MMKYSTEIRNIDPVVQLLWQKRLYHHRHDDLPVSRQYIDGEVAIGCSMLSIGNICIINKAHIVFIGRCDMKNLYAMKSRHSWIPGQTIARLEADR